MHVEIEAPRILAPTHRWGPIPTAAASIQTTAGSSGVLRSDPKLNRSPSSGVPRRLGVDQRLGRWRPGRPREESRGRRSQRGMMRLDGKSPGLVTRPKLPIMSVWAAPTDVDRMADSLGEGFLPWTSAGQDHDGQSHRSGQDQGSQLLAVGLGLLRAPLGSPLLPEFQPLPVGVVDDHAGRDVADHVGGDEAPVARGTAVDELVYPAVFLLDEHFVLPGAEWWWCGPNGRASRLGHLDHFVDRESLAAVGVTTTG